MLAADPASAGIPHVVGLDVDRPVLERARARHEGKTIEWMQGDVLDAAFAPDSFDAVVSVAALHHMDAAESLARFARLVRPGGTVAIGRRLHINCTRQGSPTVVFENGAGAFSPAPDTRFSSFNPPP